jgi:GNAT superfamily N-acetyltransferase
MIVILDGPINAGKSTVAGLLAQRLNHAVHIEVDRLRHFAGSLTLEKATPYALADAASLAKVWVERGFHVIVDWPVERSQTHGFSTVATETGSTLFVFTLLPRLEVALRDRGQRSLSEGEQARVKAMYRGMYASQVVGTVIDNSDQEPNETVEVILAQIEAAAGRDDRESGSDAKPEPAFALTDRPAAADAAYIKQRIREFNDSVSEHHRLARRTGKEPLAAVMHDSRGELIGGLFATVYWGWLDLDELWIAESWRGQGHGRTLMGMVEEAAVKRGCRLAQVRTWDFQARGFYERFGYIVAGSLEDFPPGRTFYWLRKTLTG